EAVNPSLERAVACPLEAGDATVHHRMTLHGAGPNITGEARRAYVMGFGIEMAKPIVERDYDWNRVKRTARAARYTASLPPAERARAKVKALLAAFRLR